MILVTGTEGMVGSHLGDVFRDDELFRTDMIGSATATQLDVRDRDQVMRMIERVQPSMVLHLGAETDVDRCEREPDHAYRSNMVGTLNIALACKAFDIELVYVSTTGVFDGANPEPYTEFDDAKPLTVYAKSKYEGEKAVASLLSRYYICRAGWMFGGRARDKKFVGRIVQLCQTQPEILAVSDKGRWIRGRIAYDGTRPAGITDAEIARMLQESFAHASDDAAHPLCGQRAGMELGEDREPLLGARGARTAGP